MRYDEKVVKQMLYIGGEKMRIDRVKLVTELAKRDMTQKKLAEIAGISELQSTILEAEKIVLMKWEKKLQRL